MFKVSARTILELGSELISSDIIAFYELIKNGFDAGSKNGVEIEFHVVMRRNSFLRFRNALEKGDSIISIKEQALKCIIVDAEEKMVEEATSLIEEATTRIKLVKALEDVQALNKIIIADTGTGMSAQQLNDCFLVIGTPSRKRDVTKALEGGKSTTPFLGEKGIGRLSAMRLGHRLRVESCLANETHLNILEIDWKQFENVELMLDQIDVAPKVGAKKSSSKWSGTRIVIEDLAEDWTADRVREFAFGEFAKLTDPFRDIKSRPRIALSWNGSRQNIPWMDSTLLKHSHAKVSGVYTVRSGKPNFSCHMEAMDLGFDHPVENRTINITGADLVSVIAGTSQEVPDEAMTTLGSFSFEAYWFNRQRLAGIDAIGDRQVVKQLQEKWSGILLYRDGFRVFPYGEENDDWLELDRKALGRQGYTLNKSQFVGRVEISRMSNPQLVDQTNREGLRETVEQQVFFELIKHAVRGLLYSFLQDVTSQYKEHPMPLKDLPARMQNLEDRTNAALKKLRKVASGEQKATVEELQQSFFEFNELAKKAQERADHVEKESHQMIEMAGVGLMVEVVAHELARTSENALEQIEKLRKSSNPAQIRAGLDTLRSQLKSLSKRIRILDPLSVSGRQRSEVFDLNQLIRDTVDAHQSQFARHKIHSDLQLARGSIMIKAVKGMIVQILENLISNSKYWMQVRGLREVEYKPIIVIKTMGGSAGFDYSDNGPGIAPDNQERVFSLFFSLKEKGKRRGMGLYIARECANYHGGSLILDDEVNPESKRLHRFMLELPKSTIVS